MSRVPTFPSRLCDFCRNEIGINGVRLIYEGRTRHFCNPYHYGRFKLVRERSVEVIKSG